MTMEDSLLLNLGNPLNLNAYWRLREMLPSHRILTVDLDYLPSHPIERAVRLLDRIIDRIDGSLENIQALIPPTEVDLALAIVALLHRHLDRFPSIIRLKRTSIGPLPDGMVDLDGLTRFIKPKSE